MVEKACPACDATFDWPLYTQTVKCPACSAALSLDRQVPVRSEGSRIMVIGLVVLALGVLVAVLTAL